MIKAVIFDFDDTLVDTKRFVIEHMLRTVMENGGEIDQELIEDVLKENLPFEEIFQKLFSDKWKFYLEKYRETAPNTKYKPIEGMLEYVDLLRRNNTLLYILSNRTRMLNYRLEQAGFNPEDFEIFEALEGHKKPDQLAYTPVLKEIEKKGLNKEEVLVIGNHLDDYIALPDEWKECFRSVPGSDIEKDDVHREISSIKLG